MAPNHIRGRNQAKRGSSSTASVGSTLPDSIYWDYDVLWTATEELIRSTIVQLGFPPAHPQVPLSLWVLPDELPGGFKRPNHYLLSLLAIWGSPLKRLKLSEIYDAIDERYPSLEEKRPAYKRSLRHKLSLEPVFVNIKKAPDNRISALEDETRGNDWIVDIRRIDFPKRGRAPRNAGGSLQNLPIYLSEVYGYTAAPIESHPNLQTPFQITSHQSTPFIYSEFEDNYGYQPEAVGQDYMDSALVPYEVDHPTAQTAYNAGVFHHTTSNQVYSHLINPNNNNLELLSFPYSVNNNYQNCTFFR